MEQFVFRFLIGGLVVSLFAVSADILKPKSFAGLFGAAPSVGLATLCLAIVAEGKSYTATEARSMAVAAVAFLPYACIASRLMLRYRWHARIGNHSGLGAVVRNFIWAFVRPATIDMYASVPQFLGATTNQMVRVRDAICVWRHRDSSSRHRRKTLWSCHRGLISGVSSNLSRKCDVAREASA